MRFIDTHSHLFLENFSEDLSSVIERAKSAGIFKIFLPNIDSSTIEAMLTVASSYKGYCYPMIGLHPTSVKENYKEELEIIKRTLENPGYNFIGIGEVGIDLYWDKTYKKQQINAFEEQIEWAIQKELPLVIHSREAFTEIVEVLDNYKMCNIKGIFHSFGGNLEEANRLLEFEQFLLGINGTITFKKSSLSEVLKEVALNRIVLETDSPYLAPVPERGKRNESAFLKYTLRKVAEVYQKTEEEISRLTTENILKIFKITEGSQLGFKVY